MAKLVYVLDTGAFLGRLHPTEGRLLTSPLIEAEIKPAAARRYLEQMLELDTLIFGESSPKSRERVEAAAKASGDWPNLSDTDRELLALALEEAGVLVTSDYSMQNVALALNIEFLPLAEGQVSQQWRWGRRCSGCGRRFEKNEITECPVCGSPTRRYRLE